MTRNPLDKYTKGITLPVHDADPDAAYELIDQQSIEEWNSFLGEKLLAIPFENDAKNPNCHEEVSNLVFTAAAEITHSPDLGVVSPLPNDDAKA